MARTATEKATSAAKVVEEVFGRPAKRDLWGAGYFPLLPVTPQDFAIGGVLPAVLYMMRWGQRRGPGKFVNTFGNPSALTKAGQSGTVQRVAKVLSQYGHWLEGFDGDTPQAALSDLLLAFCLENRKHAPGRDQPVIRAYPTHYFSSWLDLPKDVAHLRYVPELLVAILAAQDEGPFIERRFAEGDFTPGIRFKDNRILSFFCDGTISRGQPDSVRSDHFWGDTEVGIDQLLTVRIAGVLEEAPTPSIGKNKDIPNQKPAAELASERLLEDFSLYLHYFGSTIPRLTLIPMIESCIAVGLATIFLSTLWIAFVWKEAGTIPEKIEQIPWPVFVDCSSGEEPAIRRLAESSFDHIMDRLDEFAKCVMCMRVLARQVKDEKLRIPHPSPNPKPHLDFLGDILFERHPDGPEIRRDIRKKCNTFAEELEALGEDRAIQILSNEDVHPAWRLAEALTMLMGDKLQMWQYRKFLDSCLLMNEPNGLGSRRKSTVQGKLQDRRSLVLTNTVLDYLVHRHLIPSEGEDFPRNLSVAGFIRILRDRYGFYIDEAPPGFSIPSEDLRRNRLFLERRLRDLGLFSGVNDAESMKRLQPRYESGRTEGGGNAC